MNVDDQEAFARRVAELVADRLAGPRVRDRGPLVLLVLRYRLRHPDATRDEVVAAAGRRRADALWAFNGVEEALAVVRDGASPVNTVPVRGNPVSVRGGLP